MENQSTFKYLEVQAYKGPRKVVKRIDVTNHPDHSIERIDGGLNRNMNHADYYSIVTTSETELETF